MFGLAAHGHLETDTGAKRAARASLRVGLFAIAHGPFWGDHGATRC